MARFTGGGSDLLNSIGGYNGEDVPRSKRPVLAYGDVFEKRGYRCKSRDTGLTCRRNGHGFFLLAGAPEGVLSVQRNVPWHVSCSTIWS